MSADDAQNTPEEPREMADILPTHWREETALANGVRQHYYRTGPGSAKPSVVLLHGFTENGLCWSRVARALEDEYDLLLLDARGHGGTELSTTEYSQDTLTADVVAFIRELGLERPVVWGYSNGARTAADVAAAAPNLLNAVIVEDPPWSDENAPPRATAAPGAEPWPGYTQWRASWIAWHESLRGQTFAERRASAGPFLPPGAESWPTEELLTHLEAQAQFNLATLERIPPLPPRTPWRPIVECIACPLLLLSSDSVRGGMLTPEMAAEIAATWREGEHVMFPGASHFLHHEMSDEDLARFLAVVRAFLDRV